MKRGLLKCTVAATLLAAVPAASAGLAFGVVGSAAKKSGGNADVVRNTVYDGGFADSQNAWSSVQVQFAVTRSDEVTEIAPAAAFCAPPGQIRWPNARIRDERFNSKISQPGDFHLTISGRFEAHGRARGTGVLQTQTIQGQPCKEVGTWTAKALPKGTKLCPRVDTGFNVKTSVTDMTCAKAGFAYAAGVRELQHEGPQAKFKSPGYDCTDQHSDPDVRTVCTRGKEIFRLP